MANAMKGVTKALVSMNKKMDLPGLNKVRLIHHTFLLYTYTNNDIYACVWLITVPALLDHTLLYIYFSIYFYIHSYMHTLILILCIYKQLYIQHIYTYR